MRINSVRVGLLEGVRWRSIYTFGFYLHTDPDRNFRTLQVTVIRGRREIQEGLVGKFHRVSKRLRKALLAYEKRAEPYQWPPEDAAMLFDMLLEETPELIDTFRGFAD